jgi:hypothetical protein
VRSGSIPKQPKKPAGRATRGKSARRGRSTDVIAPLIRAEDLVRPGVGGVVWSDAGRAMERDREIVGVVSCIRGIT